MEQKGQEWVDLAEDFATDSDLSDKFDDELAKRDVIGYGLFQPSTYILIPIPIPIPTRRARIN